MREHLPEEGQEEPLEDYDCLEDLFERLLLQEERFAKDCMNCGMCKSCVDRSIAAAEEQESEGT